MLIGMVPKQEVESGHMRVILVTAFLFTDVPYVHPTTLKFLCFKVLAKFNIDFIFF